MKKFVKFAAIAALTAMSLTSCDEDEDTGIGAIDDAVDQVDQVNLQDLYTTAYDKISGSNVTKKTLSGDFEDVDYIGAFGGGTKDEGWKWDKAWINFNPLLADYSSGDIVEIAEVISTNTTWDASKRYLLKGNIYVESGATLTIPAGTVVMGDKASKGALIISRGAKIMAQGTADNPIIFTSSQPKATRGRGDWGGLVICGKAITNKGTDATIEGISAASGDNGKYGGTDNADNSGVLTYARIEFAGIALSPDNELNSLTMGAVGSGTEIHHIMVSYAGDDAFEWFGGAVDHKYLIAYSTLDDDFDTDAGYVGKLQYGLVMRDYRYADKSGARGLEASSSSSDAQPRSNPVFANFTVLGPGVFKTDYHDNFAHGVRADKSSAVEVYNSVIAGFPMGIEDKTGNMSYEGIIFSDNTADMPN